MLKNDTLVFTPGLCEMFKERTDCLEAGAGIKCVWNTKKESCEGHPPHRAKAGLEACPSSKRPENFTNVCEMLKGCSACTSTTFGCVWCQDECKWVSCTPETLPVPGLKRKGRFNSGFSEDNAKDFEGEILKAASVVSEVTLQAKTKPEECPVEDSLGCPRLHTCHSCMATKGCEWDGVKVSNCREMKTKTSNLKTSTTNATLDILDADRKPSTLSDLVLNPPATCNLACSERSSCSNCTNSLCMW